MTHSHPQALPASYLQELPVQRRLAVLAAQFGPSPAPSTSSGVIVVTPTSAPGEAALAAASAGIALHPDIAAALRSGARPVVALESTIVAHGMPWPDNLETALAVEAEVRKGGGVPATVAVLGGVPTVGLTRPQLERIARGGAGVRKVSTRDLGAVIAAGRDGATTVAATAALASRAGISVFVTGGLGGVHRGGETSLDVSADLDLLARTPIAVVCAGAKSVLDIPRTLEALETRGVPVVAVGQDQVPAFFTRSSGCTAPARVDSPGEAASLVAAHLRLGLGGGVILAVPCPPGHEAAAAAAEAATAGALAAADAAGATGAAATPFILAALAKATGGASLAANIALVKNNAAFGTAVAVALAQKERGGGA